MKIASVASLLRNDMPLFLPSRGMSYFVIASHAVAKQSPANGAKTRLLRSARNDMLLILSLRGTFYFVIARHAVAKQSLYIRSGF